MPFWFNFLTMIAMLFVILIPCYMCPAYMALPMGVRFLFSISLGIIIGSVIMPIIERFRGY